MSKAMRAAGGSGTAVFGTGAFGCVLLVVLAANAGAEPDPLPSWNESAARKSIVAFVNAVTDASGPGFVEPAKRIATFDNDGTLWAEQPMYFQLLFAIDRVNALVSEHPEWKTQEPFASVLRGNVSGALAGGEHSVLELVVATHAGNTTAEFDAVVRDWIASARHPKTGRLFTEMVYQPMLELLAYLRANDFKTYIVSGGGVEFNRAWAGPIYGIPPEQVVGSRIETSFEIRDGIPVLVRGAKLEFLDDKEGKPVAIQQRIGRRPILAFGNSDGDLQMLQWTAAGEGLRLAALLRHTDAEREWAYDRESSIGRLDAALDEARNRGWTVVDMANDWKQVYPPGRPEAPQ